MRIAVIGSGIAGLTAAWRLGLEHCVELYEARPTLGMDSSSVDVDLAGGTARVDVPLRVYGSGYYPNLLKLYSEAGIACGRADYSASYGRLGVGPYFGYRSHHWAGRALSLPDFRLGSVATNVLRTVSGARLFLHGPRRLAAPKVSEVTIADYLRQRGYSAGFCDEILWPTLSAILTCSLSDSRAQPAAAVIDFFGRILGRGFSRVASGTQAVVRRLSTRVGVLHLNTPVLQVMRGPQGVELMTAGQVVTRFDHVIFATQVHRVSGLLADASDAERRALQAFEHTQFSCVVHEDAALIPARREHWRPINAQMRGADEMPMYTMWMNAIVPELAQARPLFQTINPLQQPDPARVHKVVHLDRPVLSVATLPAVRTIRRLHTQAERRIWFAGSYCTEGFPLLEAAVVSANEVARRISEQAVRV